MCKTASVPNNIMQSSSLSSCSRTILERRGSPVRDAFVSRFSPHCGNEGAVVQVDAAHPPNFDLLQQTQNVSPRVGAPESPDPEMQIELCDRELWGQFSRVGTEMIVTKSGRRMFPGYRLKLSGLDPEAHYCVIMDIVNVDQHRYKFQQGEWMVAGRGEPHSRQRLYIHPDSPATGRKWMEDIVSFYKVKLTNSASSTSTEKIALNSMHRYQPRIHVIRTDDVSTLHLQPASTFSFPQTVFITVTAYQNGQVTKLKIDNNPFAKGFRDNGGRSGNPPPNRGGPPGGDSCNHENGGGGRSEDKRENETKDASNVISDGVNSVPCGTRPRLGASPAPHLLSSLWQPPTLQSCKPEALLPPAGQWSYNLKQEPTHSLLNGYFGETLQGFQPHFPNFYTTWVPQIPQAVSNTSPFPYKTSTVNVGDVSKQSQTTSLYAMLHADTSRNNYRVSVKKERNFLF